MLNEAQRYENIICLTKYHEVKTSYAYLSTSWNNMQ